MTPSIKSASSEVGRLPVARFGYDSKHSKQMSAPDKSAGEITRLLSEWKAGDGAALERLVPLLYSELHRMAEGYMRREAAGHTLQATALVNEAYMRLVQGQLPDWESRAHFFGVAAHLMRQLLVEHARRSNSQKRGSGAVKLSLDESLTFAPEQSSQVLNLDLALEALSKLDPRKSRIIELRYFGGLKLEEVAQLLDISIATVTREQRMAQAWLYRELNAGSAKEVADDSR